MALCKVPAPFYRGRLPVATEGCSFPCSTGQPPSPRPLVYIAYHGNIFLGINAMLRSHLLYQARLEEVRESWFSPEFKYLLTFYRFSKTSNIKSGLQHRQRGGEQPTYGHFWKSLSLHLNVRFWTQLWSASKARGLLWSRVPCPSTETGGWPAVPSVWRSSSAGGPCHCPASDSEFPRFPGPEGSSAEAQAAHSYSSEQRLCSVLALSLYFWVLHIRKENRR